MSNKLQKLLQEVETGKVKLQTLTFGKDDATIIAIGSNCLRSLLKLYVQFKGQHSQQTVLKENFIGIYHHLLQAPSVHQSEEFDKLASLKPVKLFGSDLKDLHYFFAAQAQKQGDNSLLEFHLKKGVQLFPSERPCQDLSQYYMDNNALMSALLTLKHYEGPFSPKLFCQRLYCLNKMCDFDAIEQEVPKLKALLKEGNTDCLLLFLKWIGIDNQTIFEASKNYQKSLEGRQDFVFQERWPDKARPIRLAYIGSNFIKHAQSSQFGTSFFKEHGPLFELFVYSLKGDGESSSEKAIKKQVDHYVNLSEVSNEDAVERIRRDDIDIIVNCNGHADDRRPYEILFRRVAPIQMDYLGYPGTSGATFIDYYIGDPISTPIQELAPYFTEKLILLPHTYQITEHKQVYPHLPSEKLSIQEAKQVIYDLIKQNEQVYQLEVFECIKKEVIDDIRQLYAKLYSGEKPVMGYEEQILWLDHHFKKQAIQGNDVLILQKCMQSYQQLISVVQGDKDALESLYQTFLTKILPPPEQVQDRFIFCSLNHHVKLNRKDITCWNALLKQVPNSVLVLFLMFSYEPKTKLLHFFDPEVRKRVFFVGAASKELHLHRLRAMGCILDSFYYGAHTSAGDALWAQVPVVTRLGATMESRVCSSMLASAGLKELIAKDEEEYLATAIQCAKDPAFYQSILKKMPNVRRSPLFDQKLYTKHITDGYQQAWKRFCGNTPPDHIMISCH